MQGKVKVVADAVWSKLTGVFANDVLHVQVSLSQSVQLGHCCSMISSCAAQHSIMLVNACHDPKLPLELAPAHPAHVHAHVGAHVGAHIPQYASPPICVLWLMHTCTDIREMRMVHASPVNMLMT